MQNDYIVLTTTFSTKPKLAAVIMDP